MAVLQIQPNFQYSHMLLIRVDAMQPGTAVYHFPELLSPLLPFDHPQVMLENVQQMLFTQQIFTYSIKYNQIYLEIRII